MTFTSNVGCINTSEVQVNVRDLEEPKITNAITPNGDGKNDFIVVTEARLDVENEFSVFSLNGQLLFNTRNYQNDWAGTSGGDTLPSGSYLVVFKIPSLGIEVSEVVTLIY